MRLLIKIVTICILWCVSPAWAAPPSVTGTSTQYSFFGTSDNETHTVASGTNVLIVVITKLATTDSSAVTFGGVALTNVIFRDDATRQCEIWMLDDPTASTDTIAITSGAVVAHAAAAINFTNAAATPVRTANATSGTGSSTTPSLSVTAGDADDLVIDVLLTLSGTAATPGAGQTLMTSSTSGANIEEQTSSEAATGAGAVTMSWTGAPNNSWVSCGVPIISANPSAPPALMRRHPLLLGFVDAFAEWLAAPAFAAH